MATPRWPCGRAPRPRGFRCGTGRPGSAEFEPQLADEVRRAAYEIIKRKGATNHAIGTVAAALLRTCLRNEQRVLTVSRVQEGAFGLTDVALSLPAIVGRDGASTVLTPEMNDDERSRLSDSAAVLRSAIAAIRRLTRHEPRAHERTARRHARMHGRTAA